MRDRQANQTNLHVHPQKCWHCMTKRKELLNFAQRVHWLQIRMSEWIAGNRACRSESQSSLNSEQPSERGQIKGCEAEAGRKRQRKQRFEGWRQLFAELEQLKPMSLKRGLRCDG